MTQSLYKKSHPILYLNVSHTEHLLEMTLLLFQSVSKGKGTFVGLFVIGYITEILR
jgi:hypothetical protein